jgi:hypothetical protein
MNSAFSKTVAVTLLLSAAVVSATWVSIKSRSKPPTPIPSSPLPTLLPDPAHTVYNSPTENYTFEYPNDWSVKELPPCCVILDSKPNTMHTKTVEVFINRWPNISKQYVSVQAWAKALEIEHKRRPEGPECLAI